MSSSECDSLIDMIKNKDSQEIENSELPKISFDNKRLSLLFPLVLISSLIQTYLHYDNDRQYNVETFLSSFLIQSIFVSFIVLALKLKGGDIMQLRTSKMIPLSPLNCSTELQNEQVITIINKAANLINTSIDTLERPALTW